MDKRVLDVIGTYARRDSPEFYLHQTDEHMVESVLERCVVVTDEAPDGNDTILVGTGWENPNKMVGKILYTYTVHRFAPSDGMAWVLLDAEVLRKWIDDMAAQGMRPARRIPFHVLPKNAVIAVGQEN